MAPKRQRKVKKQDHQGEKKKKCEVALNLAEEQLLNSTKLTDINNDCLAHIFNHLNLVDLLNVADSSKSLRCGVEFSFTANYRHSIVYMKRFKPSKNRQYEVDDSIIIFDSTICLKFIRCFGHTIKTLRIRYADIAENYCAELDRYINTYCADTMKGIQMTRAPPYAMKNLTRRFSNVSSLDFRNCSLGPLWVNIGKWFLKINSLTFKGVNQVADSEKYIPSLETLSIELVEGREKEN